MSLETEEKSHWCIMIGFILVEKQFPLRELVNFMVLSILGLFLIILAELSLSFHTKTVLTALKDRK